jgi:hypothetical protein
VNEVFIPVYEYFTFCLLFCLIFYHFVNDNVIQTLRKENIVILVKQ